MPSIDEATAPQLDETTGHRGSGRPGYPADPYRVRRALLAGKWRLIVAGVIGVIVGFLWVKLMMTSDYETTAVLKYEGDLQVAGILTTHAALAPAADALMQQPVLQRIAEEIGHDGSLRQLEMAIDYGVDTRSGTVEITVVGETGEEAAEFVGIVTDVFMTYHKERQSRRIEGEIARGSKRIDAAEDQTEVARRRYNEFREEHGIADLSTEQMSMVKSAAKLRADSELAGSEIRALEAQVKSLEAQLASTPKSVVAAGSSHERAAYYRLREELVSARATLSPDHPRVQALQQQVNQLGIDLRSGGGAKSSGGGLVSVNTTYQVVEGLLRDAKSRLEGLRERKKGLAEMADKAQHRVEGFSDIEGEASALLAEVKVNENLVRNLRREETALEDALRDPPSGFVVLDPGAVPEYPVRNKMKIVVFGAIPMISVAFVLCLVLRREFQGLQLETPAEVAFWGNGPVLGATPWPNDPRGLDELVAGLDDFAPEAKGSLLIVGGSPDEVRLASELADRMNTDWFPMNEPAGIPSTPASQPIAGSPLQTPPPSGPYPIHGSGARSVALVRQPVAPTAEPTELARRVNHLKPEAWDGPLEGQAVRRAARLADRVVVLVRSGAMPFYRLHGMQHRMGRQRGIGYIVVGLPHELGGLPDRAGNVAAFWRS
jgi:uncharacterized protein involved in exopolysaccharide biosynthesis